jgi:hypothetical protein
VGWIALIGTGTWLDCLKWDRNLAGLPRVGQELGLIFLSVTGIGLDCFE